MLKIIPNYIVEQAAQSDIAIAQKNSDKDVILNVPFTTDATKKQALLRLGADTTPTAINIYPTDYQGKDAVKQYLDDYNYHIRISNRTYERNRNLA